jgi:hypothetical protein
LKVSPRGRTQVSPGFNAITLAALAGEGPRRGAAYAGCAAGDDYDLVLQFIWLPIAWIFQAMFDSIVFVTW